MHFVLVFLLVCLATSANQSHAQSSVCESGDAQCLELEYLRECKEAGATVQSCERWLSRLNDLLEEQQEPELAVAAGYTSIALADLSFDSSVESKYRQDARDYYLLAYSWNPQNISSLYGLAATSASPQEKADWLKKILEIDPDDSFASRSLATNLGALGKQGVLEGLTYLAASYSSMHPSAQKWALASRIYNDYIVAGEAAQAKLFLESVRTDVRGAEIQAELDRSAYESIENVRAGSSTICNVDVVAILGSDFCFGLIEGILNALDATTPSAIISDERVNIAALAIRSLILNSDKIDSVRGNWRIELAERIEISVLSKEPDSPEIFSVHALLSYTDEIKSLDSAQKAVQLAPNDANFVTQLGQLYLALGRGQEAVTQFELAKSLLPQSRHGVLDQLIRIAGDTP
ncbi:MAG: hypothetical protein Q7V56_08100 [Gammaproteobacteria bacterium]|nr:hypothetical protein [Gammaproteobacteria bacterium]